MSALSSAIAAGGLAPRLPIASVLAITSHLFDELSLRSALAGCDWPLHFVSSGRDALLFLWRNPVAVIISDANLPDGTWTEFLEEIHGFPPSIVILRRPFSEQELRRTIRSAWDRWEARSSHDHRLRHRLGQ